MSSNQACILHKYKRCLYLVIGPERKHAQILKQNVLESWVNFIKRALEMNNILPLTKIVALSSIKLYPTANCVYKGCKNDFSVLLYRQRTVCFDTK